MGGKGTFNKDFDPVCGDLAKAGRFFVPQVRVDRDLGSRDRSMVETDQVKNGQSAAFLDVLPGPRSECDHYLAGVNRASSTSAPRRSRRTLSPGGTTSQHLTVIQF